MSQQPESQKFNIHFNGRLVVGRNPADVERAFSEKFGAATAQKVFNSSSITLKRSVPRAEAMQVQATLQQLGMIVVLMPGTEMTPSNLTMADAPEHQVSTSAASSRPGKPGELPQREKGSAAKESRHTSYTREQIDAAFSGEALKPKASAFYAVTLLPVTLLMLVLPLIYFSITLLSGYSVFWLMTEGSQYVFGAGAAGAGTAKLRLMVYLASLFGMFLLTLFLAKPLVAPRYEGPQPVALDPKKESVLFHLVKRITDAVGAPMPTQINVDTDVNASAMLSSGVFSKELTLTIGLPLLYGMNVQTLSGILAHEFGHFTQRTGMRAQYIIRHINRWFYRKIYEPDSWDETVDELSESDYSFVSLAAMLAKFGSWLCRLLLKVLAWVARLCSLSLSRQMEFDADRFEIALTGSEQYSKTAEQLRILSVAHSWAQDDIDTAFAADKLGNNLPMLVAHKAGNMPDEQRKKIAESILEINRSVYDTHPADQDRINKAKAAQAEPQFSHTGESIRLLRDPDRISHLATLQWYRMHGIDVSFDDLVSMSEVKTKVDVQRKTEHARVEYYGELRTFPDYPQLVKEKTLQELPDEKLVLTLRSSIEKLNAQSDRFVKADLQLQQHISLRDNYRRATFWLKSGYDIDLQSYGLARDDVDSIQQKITAVVELEEKERAVLKVWAKYQGVRLSTALEIKVRKAPARRQEIHALRQAFLALATTYPLRRLLIDNRNVLDLQIDAMSEVSESDFLSQAIEQTCEKNNTVQQKIHATLGNVRNPLNDARLLVQSLPTIGYVTLERKPEDVYASTEETIRSLGDLIYRVDGSLVEIALEVERALETV